MRSVATRWLGVGLTSVIAVATLGLAATGRLGLYINPDGAWFAVGMSIVALVGAVLTFLVPLGAESDHGHDHAAVHGPDRGHHEHESRGARSGGAVVRTRVTATASHPVALAATVVGGVIASGVVVAALVLPPATLSVDLAMARDVGAAPLFAGADAVTLAASGDTSTFGIGEWATMFATSTSPDAFAGDAVELTGFVTPDPADPGAFLLTRLVITHCVIDAQPATVPVVSPGWADELAIGDWVSVRGTIDSTSDGLVIVPSSVERVDEPRDPYEF